MLKKEKTRHLGFGVKIKLLSLILKVRSLSIQASQKERRKLSNCQETRKGFCSLSLYLINSLKTGNYHQFKKSNYLQMSSLQSQNIKPKLFQILKFTKKFSRSKLKSIKTPRNMIARRKKRNRLSRARREEKAKVDLTSQIKLKGWSISQISSIYQQGSRVFPPGKQRTKRNIFSTKLRKST